METSVADRRSAANIKVSPRVASPSADTDLFCRLRTLVASCGSNKNDGVIAVFTACIGDGIDTGARLLGVAAKLGFNKQHAAIQLKLNTGVNSALSRWARDAEGKFSLLT